MLSIRKHKISSITKITVVNCYAISFLRYASVYWTYYPQMKKILEVIEMYFYRRMPRTQWTEHASSDDVLEKFGNKKHT